MKLRFHIFLTRKSPYIFVIGPDNKDLPGNAEGCTAGKGLHIRI